MNKKIFFLLPLLMTSACVADGDQISNQYAEMREDSSVRPEVRRSMDRLMSKGFPSSSDLAREIDPQKEICTTCTALETDKLQNEEKARPINTPVCQHFNKFKSAGVPEVPLRQALFFYEKNKDKFAKQKYVSIADYSQSSTQKRFFILDLETGEVRKEKVSHGSGKRSGTSYGDSNHDGMIDKCHHGNNLKDRENMTRAGFFVTRDFYRSSSHTNSWPRLDSNGNNGLRMVGLSAGVNDEAMGSGVVMHGAAYNDGGGAMGRSFGCPAFTSAAAPGVLGTLKGGTLYYSYTPLCKELHSMVEKQIPGWQGMCK